MLVEQGPDAHGINQTAIPSNLEAARSNGGLQAPAGFPSLEAAPAQLEHDYSATTFPDPFQPGFGTTPYGYSAFEDPMNWIPISVFPSPYENEFEHDVSFLFPDLGYQTEAALEVTNQGYNTESQGYATSLIDPVRSPESSGSVDHPTVRSTNSSAGSGGMKRKHRKSSHVFESFAQPREQKASFAFPFTSPEDIVEEQSQEYCSRQTYESIANVFRQVCVSNGAAQPFETSHLPDLHSMNAYIDLYFQKFHPTFPLLHRPTFTRGVHWLVILATAALGSSYTRQASSLDLRDAMQEFLRRAIVWNADTMNGNDIISSGLALPHAQARILSLIGTIMSGRDQLRTSAPRLHADLSSWCLESGILQISNRDAPSTAELRSWEAWILKESQSRVGHFIWLLDTSLGYLANCRPLCNMDDARAPLPCAEVLWDAPDAHEWLSMFQDSEVPPSLCAALEHMYTQKAVDARLSDISQVLLINALFQRTWEVGTHIKQPLSEWVPTGKAQGFLNTPSKDSFWLPLYPLYANWRNSACDCLDTINWQAASAVAKASGVEHDLILHLHLARIILLTPFQEIQDLVYSLIGRVAHAARASFYVHDGSYQPRNLAKLPQIRKITWRWLREDQHKARLAMVHAGSVFWHVRRYSSGSFFEPLAVYLASIVLWTYGSYKSAALERDAANHSTKPVGGPSGPDSDLSVVQPSRVERGAHHGIQAELASIQHSQSPTGYQGSPTSTQDSPHASTAESSSEADDLPEFIHLDRPCDDEMVQHFVRNGHTMSGYMSNVGDICKTPNKVLNEGAKLLRTKLSCWGVSREYFDVLTKLYER